MVSTSLTVLSTEHPLELNRDWKASLVSIAYLQASHVSVAKDQRENEKSSLSS